ncbi:nucleolar protein 10-like isoform X2 [Apostichopus japonicus]|uniref:nucleolar protein 10-like isoform X2 n=1 Tax=Stichopus japonicus TaxID=307972 RepID=UPI003AB4E017
MQVSNTNNVKVYNLSSGKSLPAWLSDRKKRALQNADSDLKNRIELIQDFEMPIVSNCVRVSEDGQHILAAGIYKPRVRCYDLSQLSMKFERGLDAEVVKLRILSEDYSKVVFMQCDRYVEFHTRFGVHHRLRIPRVGRDLAYHDPSCDLFFVGTSPEIYRFNLEQGRFLKPFTTKAIAMNCCDMNPAHHLLAAGTAEGKVICWDPRTRDQVGELDCALSSVNGQTEILRVPSVTAFKFKDALHFAVGTSTGQILLYDIRSDKPILVKDHRNQLPIKSIHYKADMDLVLSADKKGLKMWNEKTGKPFVTIEPDADINDVCVVPNSGLVLMANEAPKMSIYFTPSLGPAPKWCSFLDNLTEELEENPQSEVYDDYKFVTKSELDGLGLGHLIGSSLLRAYMHGYFMDIRLYHKAKSIADPFAYDNYKKNLIQKKIEEARSNRVKKLKKLPKVNAALALKLQDEGEAKKTAKVKDKTADGILQDSRFSALFENPDFQVDEESEEYRLAKPLISKQQKRRDKEITASAQTRDEDEVEEMEGRASSDEDSSSDDDKEWLEEMREQRKKIKQERRVKELRRQMDEMTKMYEVDQGEEKKDDHKKTNKLARKSFGERISLSVGRPATGKSAAAVNESTFHLGADEKVQRQIEKDRLHHQERKKLRRSAGSLSKKKYRP